MAEITGVRETVVVCPACGSKVLATYLKEHARTSCAGRISSPSTQRRDKGVSKARLIAVLKKKQGKSKSRHFDRTLFSKKESAALTAEQAIVRRRIQNQGFHEGAAVPGSTVRKIDK